MDTYGMLTAARVAVLSLVMLTGLGMGAPTLEHHLRFRTGKFSKNEIAEDFGAMRDILIGDSTDAVSIDRRNPNAIAEAVAEASMYYSLSYLLPGEELYAITTAFPSSSTSPASSSTTVRATTR